MASQKGPKMRNSIQESFAFVVERSLPLKSKKEIRNWVTEITPFLDQTVMVEMDLINLEKNEDLENFILNNSAKSVVFIFEPIRIRKKLSPNFLEEIEKLAESDVIYFDSLEIQRPEFSPERLRGQNYLGPFVVFRNGVLDSATNINLRYGSTNVWEIVLNLSQNKKQITRAKTQIFHEASLTPRQVGQAESQFIRDSISEFLDHENGGECIEVLNAELFPSKRFARIEPLISIIIPTRGIANPDGPGQKPLVINTVQSVENTSKHLNIEYVVVVDDGYDVSVINQLQEIAGSRLKLVLWSEPFNFSKKMNLGFTHAKGEFILLLNDDVEVISESWIEALLSLAQLPNAGMVGAMLYYEDGTIQHAGHAYYHGSPTHIGLNAPRGSKGPRGALLVDRELSGVTAACAMMPREVFRRVGGFSALLPGNFNDVDLCLKVGWAGYDIYWTPFAELFHFESKTRDAHVHYYELDVIAERWGPRLEDTRFWPGHPENVDYL